MGSVTATAMAITMIAAFLLLGFGMKQAMSRDTRQRGVLMIACGVIFIVNVLIWTV